MLIFTTLLNYSVRFSLNMNIVCMVIPPQQQGLNSTADLVDNTTVSTTNGTVTGQCQNSLVVNKNFGHDGELNCSTGAVHMVVRQNSEWWSDRMAEDFLTVSWFNYGGMVKLCSLY